MAAQQPGTEPTASLVDEVLDEIQGRFPLQPRPYAAVAERLGVSESAVIEAVGRARDAGVIRQVSAIFDTRSLGYQSSLVAMRVPPARLDRAVEVVNAHPGVTHNYLRDHVFNLWFTLAVPPDADLDAVIARLHELAGAESTRPFPTLRLFKVGVTLSMSGKRRGAPGDDVGYGEDDQARAAGHALDERDMAFVLHAQDDLAAADDPFAEIARRLDWSVDEVVERARALQASGHLRRFAAILNHRRAGFVANGMVVWQVPEERVEEFGLAAAARPAVTHAYRRPSYPDWPYNVFTMIHGRTRADVEAVAAEIAGETGIGDRSVLYSTTEFKKVRMRYFEPHERQWDERCTAAARRWVR